jgi:hypothetical protein
MKKNLLTLLFVCIGLWVSAQDLFPFKDKKGKYGYKNTAGRIKILPKYDNAGYFNYGVAVVSNGGENGIGGKNGIIDSIGREIIPLTGKYDFIEFFIQRFATVAYPDKNTAAAYNFINRKGKEISVMRFKDTKPFSEGMAAVKSDKGWGFIDTTGKLVVPFQYYEINAFAEGLAFVSGKTKGYIDRTGKEIITCKYDHAGSFSDGLAPVGMGGSQFGGGDGKWGYIDNTGKEIIPLKFGLTTEISNGLAIVMSNEKYGALDKNGSQIIPFTFDKIWPFHEGLAVAWLNGKCGFINAKGETAVPFEYDGVGAGIEGFSEGLAAVQIADKYGYVDSNGKVVIPLKYDRAWSFSQGRAYVDMGDKSMIINKQDKQIE